jgi:hypothetical protein
VTGIQSSFNDNSIHPFREMARELDADPSEETFKAKLAVIGRHAQKDDPAGPKPTTRKARKAR